VRPFVGQDVIYLNADTEERSPIAQASTPLDKAGHFLNRRPSVRQAEEFRFEEPQRIEYMDVSPKQVVGVSAALIPFLEHDDTNRALMGSNMQRQAVPLVQPDAPIVGTGMEWQAAVDSGQVVVARKAGEAVRVVNTEIVIQEEDGTEHTYPLRKFNRSNQSTCIDQRPTIQKGDMVEAGTVLADSSSTQNGELALGQNVLVAYMSWEGGNYEDAILVSERLVENDKYTSVHIEKHEIEARETKLGPEEITRDIPNVGEDALRHLDEDGIIRIGAEVGPNDILVGKITPKGEKELSPEEKLLRAIFGEKAREVKDSSLRLPHGDSGKVVDVKTFTREEHRDLPAGVEKMVRISVAQKRKLTVGDKMAGRHGNKGVISKVVPVEDMPYLSDGRPVEIILNPLGVPGRMNIGQVLEIHLGWAAERLGFRAITPVFDGAREDEIQVELGRAWLIDHAWKIVTERALEWVSARFEPEELEDDDEIRRLYVADWLRDSETLDRELLLTDRDYARRVVLEEWLREGGHEPDDVLNLFELERRGGEPLVHPEDPEPRRGLDRVGGVPGIEDEDRLVHGVRQFTSPERTDRQEGVRGPGILAGSAFLTEAPGGGLRALAVVEPPFRERDGFGTRVEGAVRLELQLQGFLRGFESGQHDRVHQPVHHQAVPHPGAQPVLLRVHRLTTAIFGLVAGALGRDGVVVGPDHLGTWRTPKGRGLLEHLDLGDLDPFLLCGDHQESLADELFEEGAEQGSVERSAEPRLGSDEAVEDGLGHLAVAHRDDHRVSVLGGVAAARSGERQQEDPGKPAHDSGALRSGGPSCSRLRATASRAERAIWRDPSTSAGPDPGARGERKERSFASDSRRSESPSRITAV